jgi:hypothetical protein
MNNATAMHARTGVMSAMIGRSIFRTCCRTLAGETRARARKRDQAGEDGPKQRQKNDRLIHSLVFPTHDLVRKPVSTFRDHALALHQIDVFDRD